MKYVKCILCNTDNTKYICSPSLLDGPLVKCKICGLHYVNPRKSDFTEMDSFTGEKIKKKEKYLQLVKDRLNICSEIEGKEVVFKELFFQDRLRRILKYKQNGNLLEIGCASGIFLNLARQQGFNTLGIEINSVTASLARENFNFNIFTGTLAESNVANASFDVAVMFHLIEHLPYPPKEIAEISRILKLGCLLVIETPNIDNIWFKILGKRWRQFIPDHYYFFSEKSITLLLERQGFEIEKICSVGKIISIRFFLNRLGRLPVFQKFANALYSFSKVLKIENKTIYVNPGDVILIFATKKSS